MTDGGEVLATFLCATSALCRGGSHERPAGEKAPRLSHEIAAWTNTTVLRLDNTDPGITQLVSLGPSGQPQDPTTCRPRQRDSA
jgi:hypothetical protein